MLSVMTVRRFFLGFCLLGFSVSCDHGATDKRPGRPPPLVMVSKPTVRDVPVEIRAPVDLRPREQADLLSKQIGYLSAVLVDRGDVVKKGQLQRQQFSWDKAATDIYTILQAVKK